MRRYVEIVNNRVHAIGECPDDITPQIAPPARIVVLAEDDIVLEGYFYCEAGSFLEPTAEMIAQYYKPEFSKKRNQLFIDTEWVRQRHSDRIGLGVDDSANWTQWLSYWQSLRDMTLQPEFDPQNPLWPEQPK